ncbi:hypothetical protein A3K73_03100 [Candidatus Pacearchaeota archaeon RBG_13_36_9]|nr:MAG: hypothetical protein A3K73_03100 [Candidatus Pacearchaeota archaeon RBG_13_36_9]
MKTDTTIKLSRKTKERLDSLKEHSKESYEETIKKMLYILNLIRKNPEFGGKVLGSIDKNIKRKREINKETNAKAPKSL